MIHQLIKTLHRQSRALRAAQARPQVRRGPPDRLRAHPRPHRARHDHAQAEHRRARGRPQVRFADGTRRRRRRRRVLHRLQDHASRSSTRTSCPRPTTTSSCSAAFHPDIPGLYFIGLLQPLGAIMPLAEAQSTWVGDHLLGDYVLPSDAEMRADIAPTRPRCALATSPPSGTRSRSTSTTTSVISTPSAAPARSGPVPTFCRHNRFIERCPICSRTLPGAEPVTGGGRRSAREARARRGRRCGWGARLIDDGRLAADQQVGGRCACTARSRAQDDGYRKRSGARPARIRGRRPPGRGDRLRRRSPAGVCTRRRRICSMRFAGSRATASSSVPPGCAS